jgi:hypothetical protein
LKHNHIRTSAFALGLLCAGILPQAAHAQTTTVSPSQITTILGNPDMGWDTFQTISPSGVTTAFFANTDSSLPSWIPSTVSYVRPSWAEMEPSQGVLSNWLDNALANAHRAGQKVAIRPGITLRWPTGVNALPAWVMSLGATTTTLEGFIVPTYSNPVFVTQYVNFVKLLGQKYDSDPRLGIIDLSGIGAAENEWHMSPFYEDSGVAMPNFTTVEKPIIDAFFQAFPHHKMIMAFEGGGESTPTTSNQALPYSASLGAGMRGDGIGDEGFSMDNLYPYFTNLWGLQNQWKIGPIAFESDDDMHSWPTLANFTSYRAIFNYALAYHTSLINNKSAAIPTDATATSELQRFLRRLGYRLVINQFTFPNSATGSAAISMQWQNIGSAPCYASTYRVAYRLTGIGADQHFATGSVNPCTFMPGDLGGRSPTSPTAAVSYLKNPVDLPNGPVTSVSDSLAIPAGLAAGTYSLAVAIVDTSAPSISIIQLAISGKDSSGWYPMGSINVGAGGGGGTVPTISSFSASPGSIVSGGSSTLSWSIAGATSLFINNGVGTVTGASKVVSPTTTTTYVITATDSTGSSTASTAVTVSPAGSAPTITSFSASPASITSGSSSTLSWSQAGGTSQSISGIGPVSGSSQTVSPTVTTTYVLTETNSFGSTTKSTTVTVVAASPPVISAFFANPGTISAGASSLLSWTTSGASTLSISGGVGTVTGSTSRSISPATTTTYVLTATNGAGSVTQSVTVTVNPVTPVSAPTQLKGSVTLTGSVRVQ